jgi:hypothetical protein
VVTQMAPHRLFGIPEVLAEITRYVGVGYRGYGKEFRRRRKHLLWTALSCKAFSSHALDVLWRELDSLLPLLKLLPGLRRLGDSDVWVSNPHLLMGISASS